MAVDAVSGMPVPEVRRRLHEAGVLGWDAMPDDMVHDVYRVVLQQTPVDFSAIKRRRDLRAKARADGCAD